MQAEQERFDTRAKLRKTMPAADGREWLGRKKFVPGDVLVLAGGEQDLFAGTL
jgi:hypothetical protein